MFLLDTNTLSEFFKDHPKISARMNAVPGDEPVVTSIISRIEILEGRFASIKKAASQYELLIAATRLEVDEEKLATIDILPLTKAAADQFEALLANKKLKKIGRPDLLIACIALANKAILVTRNSKDFANVPGLKTENWAD